MWGSMIVLAVVVCALAPPQSSSTTAAPAPPPPQCHPSLVEDGSPRMRKICAALSTIYELSNAMEAYLDEKTAAAAAMAAAAALHPDAEGLLRGDHQLRERRERDDGERANSPLMDSGVKRQDVDHVFLRFGKR